MAPRCRSPPSRGWFGTGKPLSFVRHHRSSICAVTAFAVKSSLKSTEATSNSINAIVLSAEDRAARRPILPLSCLIRSFVGFEAPSEFLRGSRRLGFAPTFVHPVVRPCPIRSEALRTSGSPQACLKIVDVWRSLRTCVCLPELLGIQPSCKAHAMKICRIFQSSSPCCSQPVLDPALNLTPKGCTVGFPPHCARSGAGRLCKLRST